jgi:hypothetical protein
MDEDRVDVIAPGARRRRSAPVAGRVGHAVRILGRMAAWRPCFHPRGRRAAHRTRTGGGALAALIVLTFLLLCVMPAVPLLRLGADAIDVWQRVGALQRILVAGPASLLNVARLDDLQNQVDGIEGDLREIDGAANLALAPVDTISARAKSFRLLARMGVELAAAGDEGLRSARLLLSPLERGALGSSTAGGITSTDLAHVHALLGTAKGNVIAAIATYRAIDQAYLPGFLRPGSRAGNLLARLPQALSVFALLDGVLDAVPRLLGIGQPAYYLVAAMDRSELRPIGGLMGNYGVLALESGQQMKQYPLSLHNTYDLDSAYYLDPTLNSDPNPSDAPACKSSGPQPPARYWWWPIRDFSCQFGWGLRDAGLSPDFPTNAIMDMRIAERAGAVPHDAPLQGMIAFTDEPIEAILNITGPIAVPDFNTTVTAATLEQQIHHYQLLGATPPGQDRKEFTHALSIALLARLRSLHGNALKPVLKVIEQALREKEIEIYVSNPRVEALLQRVGLSAGVSTGDGDGFYVVDTNDGGNKANLYVTEQQTDVVTVLADGSVLHELRIAVAYDKAGSVYEGSTGFEDYSDVQRTYLPADAEILGYVGYSPPVFSPAACGGGSYASPITNCDDANALISPATATDLPGRAMVIGQVFVTCGGLSDLSTYNGAAELAACRSDPVPQTANIYITWLTPGAVHLDVHGHGTYHELVEKQPGSSADLSVYMLSSSVASENLLLSASSLATDSVARDAAFEALVASATRVYSGPLTESTTITYHV